MSKRGKVTTRAVSPDIVSLSSMKKVAKGKPKNGKAGQLEEGREESLVVNNVVDCITTEQNPNESVLDITKAVEMEVVKKKRGRPKKVVQSEPNLLSPDINPRTSNSVTVKRIPKKRQAKRKLVEEAPESVPSGVGEAIALAPSPEVPLGMDDVSFELPFVTSVDADREEKVHSPDVAPEPHVRETVMTALASDTVQESSSPNAADFDRTVPFIVEPIQPSSFFGGTDIFEQKYKPGFIPGLDVEFSDDHNSSKADGNNISFGSVMAKKIMSIEKPLKTPEDDFKAEERLEKIEDAENKIRRSSRIKSLEESRGPRKRREVVFSGVESASSSRSQSVAGDEDSNSSSSLSLSVDAQLPAVDDGDDSNRSQSDLSALGLSSTTLSFINILNPSLNPSSNGCSKPLKVKSRWRYSLDAESLKSSESSVDSSSILPSREPLVDTSNVSSMLTAVNFRPVSPPLGPNMVKKSGFIVYDSTDDELVEKLKKFEGIEESIFFTERKVSKESKHMVCDCFLAKEDILRGDIGCNEDCLNRLLMVECGSRCPTGDRCTNRKFQRKEYSKLEVFKTEKKGHGLRTLVPVPAGGFVIEYVGEVLSPRGFAQRTKEYAKEKQEHFYFMALRSDTIIDATQKGNCSRFINHSCDPNCETQKWTVNGELRIGFFAQRDLEAGEEITFDYQFQRYGKKAQKCFCMSEKCRGWIGGEEEELEEDDGENKEPETVDDFDLEVEERKPRVKTQRRKKKRQTSAVNEFGDRFNEELAMLERTGLKNRNHTLALCRLMVRAEDWDARKKLLTILTTGDQPCRRLFLDYHGLRLLHGWMSALPLPSSNSSSNPISQDDDYILFLKALASLPIPNKTMLSDSQVLSLVEKWSEVSPVREVKSEIKPESKAEVQLPSEPQAEVQPPEPTQMDIEVVAAEVEVKIEAEVAKEDAWSSETLPNSSAKDSETVMLADSVEPTTSKETAVEVMASLKESPNDVLEHVKWEFVEGAKRLLQDWADLKEVFRIPKKERVEQMKEHEREADKGVIAPPPKESAYDRDGRSKPSRKGDRRVPTLDSYLPYHRSMREYASQYSNLSKEERRLMFAQQVAEREKEEAKQREMQDNMVVLHQERCKLVNLDPATTPIVDPSGVYYLDPTTISWKEINPEDPLIPPELLILIHGAIFPSAQIPIHGLPVPVIPAEEPAETSFPPWPEGFPPPPPLPPPKLPSGWHIVHDPDGRFYYYHQQTREVRWVIPSPESSDISDLSSSEDSSDSEDDVTVDDDSVDLTVSDNGSAVTVVSESLEKGSKSLERQERRKLSGLVQERIISPRSEDDKPLLSQKAIRARKLELMAEKHGLYTDDAEEDVMREFSSMTDSFAERQDLENGDTMEVLLDSDGVVTSPVEKKRKIVTHDEAGVIGDGVGADLTRSDNSACTIASAESTSSIVASESRNDTIITSPGSEVSSDPIRCPSSVTKSGPSKPSNEKKRPHKKNKSSSKKSVDKVDLAKRLKEKKSSEEYFRNQIANVIVQNLNPYRKADCKNGRITSTEDFKHLARKLTHMVTTKEVKHCKNAKTLVVNDSVRHKTKEFVKKYMGKFAGRTYCPSPQENLN